jgi:hypothetical protein
VLVIAFVQQALTMIEVDSELTFMLLQYITVKITDLRAPTLTLGVLSTVQTLYFFRV